MKKNFFTLCMIALASMTFLPSCKDACKDVTCLNGGTCDEGNCTCASGYEGETCATEARAKYFGNYASTVILTCPGQNPQQESDTIVVKTSTIGINNIKLVVDEDGGTIEGVLNGNNITFASQPLPDGDGATISGTGSFSSTTPYNLTLNMTIGGVSCTVAINGRKL